MKTTIKYICSVLLMLSGFGFLIKGSFLSGLLFFLLGLSILPPISDNLKTKIKAWKTNGIRYVAYIILFFGAGMLSSPRELEPDTVSQDSNTTNVRDYLERVEKEKPSKPKVDFEVTANQLFKAYDANEISADNKFKGKELAVTGVINEISEVFGDVVVDLKSGDGIGWATIRCSMKKRNEVVNLSKGERVTIVGTCEGLTLNVAINMEKCRVLQE